MTPTFPGVLSLDHTAVALWKLESALPFYTDLLGGKVVYESQMQNRVYRFVQIEYPNGAKVELLEPVGDAGFLHDFLNKRGEGIHHMTFIVEDLETAVEAVRATGYRVVGESYANPDWKEAFVSPRDVHGTLIQLAQKGENHPTLTSKDGGCPAAR